MDTPPHDGYAIVKQWADLLFSPASALPLLQPSPSVQLARSGSLSSLSSSARPTSTGVLQRPGLPRPAAPSQRAGSAGVAGVRRKKTHFVYTSNVDTMFARAGFERAKVFEIHGNVVEWQCGAPCGAPTWRLPREYRFHVGSDMRAPRTAPAKPQVVSVGSQSAGEEEEEEEEAKPHDELEIPRVGSGADSAAGGGVRAVRSLGKSLSCYAPSGGGLSQSLQPVMRGGAAGGGGGGARENHVVCGRCGRRARPNVLMFDDEDWEEPDGPPREYARWEKAALGQGRTVIVEGGCGKRVPTVRLHNNALVKKGAWLIRINSLEGDAVTPPAGPGGRTVSLKCGVLHALRGIDAFLARTRGVREGAGGVREP